jgi:hypothetical protein
MKGKKMPKINDKWSNHRVKEEIRFLLWELEKKHGNLCPEIIEEYEKAARNCERRGGVVIASPGDCLVTVYPYEGKKRRKGHRNHGKEARQPHFHRDPS